MLILLYARNHYAGPLPRTGDWKLDTGYRINALLRSSALIPVSRFWSLVSSTV